MTDVSSPGEDFSDTKDALESLDTKDESYDSRDSGDSGIQEDVEVESEAGWTVRDGAGREHAVVPFDPSELRGHCRALDSGAVRVGEGLFALPRHGLLSLPSYSAPRTIRPGELVVCSVPKSGTTWTLEMAWLVANDCDFEGARSRLDQNRYTEVGNLFYLGLTPAFLREYVPLVMTRLRKLAGLVHLLYLMLRSLWQSVGLVKTHVPLSLLPPDLLETNKVIYVTRNPKDALVSYYHHFSRCRVVKYSGSMDDLAEDYMAGRLPGLPFFSHVLEAWRQRHHPNMLFLFYEDMKRDMPGTLRRVATFLGKTLTTEQVEKLCHHLDFKHMKNNEHANSLMYQKAGILDMPSFIREGQVGKGRQHFSSDMDRRLNEWIRLSVAGTGLSYEGVQ
ncbi:Sulfotransferase 1C4 [Amphibalanus amphitrite]|uniref:Sulfotransferase 1C4 n=1 Tax=Amphibalanus amphitrite TaxID=1232801 RepID=A0A6A4W7K1_AMPAM|nr:Sulfotransferase 1C4 [Amphibalanus amphitrite]